MSAITREIVIEIVEVDNPEVYASQAATSATAAEAARVAAVAAQTAAVAAKVAAEAAQTAAAASAATATTKAGEANSSASAAATSATAAEAAKVAAQTAQTAAVAAKNAAETAQAAAAAKYTDFDNRYLGPKSTNPTTDNNGGTLGSGALYFNTAAFEMRVWNGTAWQNTPFSLPTHTHDWTGGMKNRIINGDMRIDQRNSGAAITPIAAAYAADRWMIAIPQPSKVMAGRNLNGVVPPAGFTDYIGLQCVSQYAIASSDNFVLLQRVEGRNIYDFDFGKSTAKTITVSFWVRSSITGLWGGGIRNRSANRSYPFSYTINSADVWEKKTITIPGDATGTWETDEGIGLNIYFAFGLGSTFSGTAGVWAGANYNGVTGGNSLLSALNATLYITGVQLEAGNTATDFEWRDYGRELAMCQRYYEEIHIRFGTANTSAMVQQNVMWRVTKRITPTATIYADTTPYAKTGASGNIRNESASTNVSAGVAIIAGDLNGGGVDFVGANPANWRGTITLNSEF